MSNLDKPAVMALLFDELLEDLNKNSSKKIEEVQKNLNDKIKSVEEKAKNYLNNVESLLAGKPFTVNFGTVESPKNEVVHSAFHKILKIIQSMKRKEKNIMLVGGAGGGKTHLVNQVAKSLGLEFYPFSVGSQTTKSDLLGFINANGVYMPSVIRQAYENGGVLLLDEFDAAHPGVVTILNSLLANGHSSFPDKIVSKHEKFICICACNTYGKGANIDYVGRNRLDAATLDRFIVVDVDYDSTLEKILTQHDIWFEVISKIRKNINELGIKLIVSPRASMDGADLLEAGFSLNEVLEMTVLKGSDKDIRGKVLKGINLEEVQKSLKAPKYPDTPKIESRKNKSKNNPAPIDDKDDKDDKVDDEDIDFKIWVSLDDLMYYAWAKESFNGRCLIFNRDKPVEGAKSNWTVPFNICFSSSGEYVTYLNNEYLFVNETGKTLKSFDRANYCSPSIAKRFWDELQDKCDTYRGEWNINFEVKYRGETQLYRLRKQ